MRLLLVDDDVDLLMALSMAFSARGFEVERADAFSEAEAIVVGHGQELGAVMTDIDLGEGPGGLDLLARVRELYPSLPVVLMSGRPIEELRSTPRALGATAIFQKPVAVRGVVALLEGHAET